MNPGNRISQEIVSSSSSITHDVVEDDGSGELYGDGFVFCCHQLLTNWFNQNNVDDTRLCYKYLFTVLFQVQMITDWF